MLLSFVEVCFADDDRRDYYAVVPDESRRCALLVASYRDERVSVGFEDAAHAAHLFCKSMCVSTRLMSGHSRSCVLAMSAERLAQFLHLLSLQPAPLEMRAVRTSGFGEGMEFVLRADASEVLNACARAAGLIRDVDVVEEISLHIAPAKSARSFATASLAVMMAAHGRLGESCRLGVLGGDVLRMVCETYRARLYECPEGVWE